jgi:D-glycerate 3-kinase
MLVLGINGAQGSGKSTWAALLALICRHRFGWNVATLSLDDLYLGSEQRQRLACEVHPLLATRGVPGTHDVQLGLDIIEMLRDAGSGEEVRIPRFDKARDEPFPSTQWGVVHGPIDLLIFEGWCLGAAAQSDAELIQPYNALERQEDGDGVWRQFVNRQLAEFYPPLFAGIDYRVFLKVPDFSAVLRWRSEQEERLRVSHAGGAGVMNAAELKRFVQFFERLTRHQLDMQPAVCDVVFELDHAHGVAVAVYQTHG